MTQRECGRSFPRSATALLVSAAATVMLLTGSAHAQVSTTSFVELSKQLRVGDTVLVTDVTGRTVKGAVEQVSETMLVLRRHQGDLQLAAPAVLRVARLESSVWRGAAIGAGVGFAFGAILVAADQQDCSAPQWCFNSAGFIWAGGGFFGAIGAGSGAIIGAFFPRERAVFARPAKGRAQTVVTPWLTQRGGTGVFVQIRF